MHPNTFVKVFWRLEVRPEVFVAMNFAPQYSRRYEEVIAPAIQALQLNGKRLRPRRVDSAHSGESILTEISDAIAHSCLVLADVSTIGRDAVTGKPYRNGNVMYEVGIALATRQPHEVLLVRDDDDPFLFDVSTIPHKRIDFTDIDKARDFLQKQLQSRLDEASFLHDARVRTALASLSDEDDRLLRHFTEQPNEVAAIIKQHTVPSLLSVSRLLDKQLIRTIGHHIDGTMMYRATPLGRVVAKLLHDDLEAAKKDAMTLGEDRGLK
ncbi:MAG TPA: hypothetical protein VGN72_02830 [Tepidisphaeraceae bacterium]|jgi:hypothetical protein|nr:hypothetical protein [Tepidisphaeraceae bacterium]